jgi:phosphate transport system protein
MFEVLFGQWAHDVRAAVDAALLARFYERYADHAVSAAQQVVYLVTGVAPGNRRDRSTPGGPADTGP